MLFLTKNGLKDLVKDIMGEGNVDVGELKNRISDLKRELEELKLKKDIEQRDIEHLVKCKTEKNNIENERKLIDMERILAQKEATLQTEYHKKAIVAIEKFQVELKELYQSIIQRLPDVNVAMNIGSGKNDK